MNKSMIKEIKDLIRFNSMYQNFRERKKIELLKDRWAQLPADQRAKDIRVVTLKRSSVNQIVEMLKKIRITIKPGKRFQSWIDVGCVLCNYDRKIGNTSPNYSMIIEKSIEEIKNEMSSIDNEIARQNIAILCAVENYIDRVVEQLSTYKDERSENTCRYYKRMKNCSSETFEEALQRIAFWSSIFWQSGHRLMGLGRLDSILEKYILTSAEETIDIIQDFYLEMNQYYAFKSNAESLGDTGQIIILGGKTANGSYFSNSLTYCFIEALKRRPMPDPKLLLRVSKDMPRKLLELCIDCISTGVGSPLIANDETIIPKLIEFGYKEEDAYNYIVSACWEPLSYGCSLEQNNIADINFAQVFVDTYSDDTFCDCCSFEELIVLYKDKLDKHIDNTFKTIDAIRWTEDPLLSLFTMDCLSKNLDISKGGARYNNYGLLSVGLSNAINSLLFIRDKVINEKKYTLREIQEILFNNYNADKNLIDEIRSESNYFGHDDETVIGMAEDLIKQVDFRVKGYKNCFGGKAKWGLSSSNYQVLGRKTKATMDGRTFGEHLAVHISPTDAVAYSELFSFASQIMIGDYQSNGNTIDFFVSPSILSSDRKKFVDFIAMTINNGLFEMQMNVIDSKTLIDAKNHPEKHKDLIVRVWGFSSYFNDLPEDYKDVLIDRALKSEGKVAI